MVEISAVPKSQQTRIFSLVQAVRTGSAVLWPSVLAMIAFGVLGVALSFVDGRLINGVSVWDKPAKFFFSLAVQFATVSWALNFLPKISRGVQNAVLVMLACGWAEVAYITARAAWGLTSHFNYTTVFSSVAYGLMGLGAVSMTTTSFYVGWKIWREKKQGIWAEAAALGLMVGAVLGTLAGGYLSQQAGHWVGGAATDAGGLPVFNWSTTGGDLRIAHFIGLHAAQAIPFAALTGNRAMVYGTALATAALTLAAFLQAVLGVPLLAV